MPDPNPVAVVTTVYYRHSHADVIAGKILEGPNYDGKNLYGLRVASMYVDQIPKGDLSEGLAKRFGFRLCKSIDEALTLGGDKLAVEGILCIGEHGNYEKNEKGCDRGHKASTEIVCCHIQSFSQAAARSVTFRLKTLFALSSKIIFLSAAVSQSIASIVNRVSSSQRPVFGSLTVPTPGRSVPNRHRSTPTVLKSSSSASFE